MSLQATLKAMIPTSTDVSRKQSVLRSRKYKPYSPEHFQEPHHSGETAQEQIGAFAAGIVTQRLGVTDAP